MQNDQLDLNVDAANTGTTAVETYSRYEEYQNRSVYIGDGHLPEQRDTLSLYRTFPTRTGNFKGVSKSAIKVTCDVDVPGVDSSTTLTAPIILDLSFSVPVGVDASSLKHARQRLLAMIDDDTFMDSLNIQLMV